MPGWSSEGAAKDRGESISGSRDSENKDGLMSAHFQWAASPSEKAGLLLSALLIGLVNLGSRGLDTTAHRTASASGDMLISSGGLPQVAAPSGIVPGSRQCRNDPADLG